MAIQSLILHLPMRKNEISVVIICKNAVSTIEKAIRSSLMLADDVVVVDSGSTDGTLEKISANKARLIQIQWKGYGNAKNIGNEGALNDWILSLDADEYIDDTLIKAIRQFEPQHKNMVGIIKRLNYLGQQPMQFGEWSNDMVIRLFNKNFSHWDISEVHERLIIDAPVNKFKLKGRIHHYTSPDIRTYEAKLEKYALLAAEKYLKSGKKAPWYKIYFSPVFSFVQNYFLKMGFLDGKKGLQIALAHFNYNYKKYKFLKEISNQSF